MKFFKTLTLAFTSLIGVVSLSGCAINYFEEEINVVFKNEGEIVDHGVVTQFKNIGSPTIPESYIPEDFRFLGWTALNYNQLDLHDATHFKTQYIGKGRMVHYMDVKQYAVNSTVTLNALILHKDEIPKDYHYAVIAWYDKTGTSGITAGQMSTVSKGLGTYLSGKGVSQEDINSIVIRGYTGNVGPSTGQILYDGDVDIMFGWGSNISTTGSIPPEMILQEEDYQVTYNGEIKTRKLHRLSDTAGALTVTEYLLSEEARAIFN